MLSSFKAPAPLKSTPKFSCIKPYLGNSPHPFNDIFTKFEKSENPSKSVKLSVSCKVLKKIFGGGGSDSSRTPKLEDSRFSVNVAVDNDASGDTTLIIITAENRTGLLQTVTRVFKAMGVQISKANLNLENGSVVEKIYMTDSKGNKIEDGESLNNIRKALLEALEGPVSNARDYSKGLGPRVYKKGIDFEGPEETRGRAELLFKLMDRYLSNDVVSIQRDILDHVEYTVARNRFVFDDFEAYQATAHSVRDRLIESWNDTQHHFRQKDPKRLYYLSLEFLMGRSLSNSIHNLRISDQYAEALRELGFELETLREKEADGALGNGGLARLSACLMDSLSTLDFPAWGYGLRYQYGLFRQVILDGFQHEQPDYWLNFGNPWEIERVHIRYPVKFYGKVEEEVHKGRRRRKWIPGEMVEAVAYDNPIPGYDTGNTINLRLWAAKPSGESDLVAETRFASHTIVLRRLVRVKEALCQMVISNKWGGWKQVDTEKAKIVKDLIFSDDFWNRVEYALELTEPLMSMLRYADTDEPCLGNIYDAMDSMLERMKSVIQRREQDPDTLYSTVEKIVLHRWNKMTTPLHLLAYALSPRYYSSEILDIPGRVSPYRDPEVAAGYKRALNRLFSDPDVASNVRREFVDFVSGKFAEPDAINDQSRLDAIGWWYLHGERYMYLQPLAIKILSQHESFSTGDYINAIINKQRAETISSVLYPDDRSYQGKELRLKQQYFFVSSSLQDIMRRFKDFHKNIDEFPEKVALQLNDTHPAIAIPELMRMLVDEENVEWNRAWEIVKKVFSFTNHTVQAEALEKVPVELLGNLLPRHLQIIYDINFFFLEDLKKHISSDFARLARMSIIEEGAVKSVRMANLSIVASHSMNGVSRSHSEILKTSLFKDFFDIWPHKFQSITNGVTQRRWLAVSNPGLRDLITKWLGTEAWLKDLDLLMGLREHATNPKLQSEWRKAHRLNKRRLAEYIEEISGLKVSIDAMFDVQVKRIHEYKRQFLNVLSIIHRYECIKHMTGEEKRKVVPRVCLIGGKAAPGYEIAKKIIKLIHVIGEKINNDPDIGNLLKLVFVADYSVSVAELIIPASDLSQQISTAGHEASGTGSMKFLMNGCLILGTLDGSTIEIAEEIGEENMFTFGAKVHEVPTLRSQRNDFIPPREFTRVIRMIRDGYFGHKEYFQSLCDSVDRDGDFYLLGNDFASYLEAQAAADRTFVDQEKWTCMSILSTAGSGKFSTDRTIREYAQKIWGIQPCQRPC